jgi:23S rRNA (uracil1939-C5)-methyltransferase
MPVNPPVTKRMYHRIHEMCDLHGSEVILDLYCGFGALSLMCALNAAQVIALDKKSSHIQDAVRNAEENHIQNITFYQGDIEKKLAEVIAEKNLLTVDVIFLNPHKEGCGVSLAEKVASLKPKSIFYISSFLDTLVQDLKHLKAHHYTPLFLEPFDSLPGTSNYDVLCYLTRESDVCD